MTSQALVPSETKRTAAHLGDKAEFERLIAHELSGLDFPEYGMPDMASYASAALTMLAAQTYNDQFFKNSLHVESVDKMLVKPEPTEGERLAAFFGRSEHDAHKPKLVVKAPMATKEIRELRHEGQSAMFSITVVDGVEKVYESSGFRLRLTSVDAQLTSQRFGVLYNYRYPVSSILACLDAHEAVLTATDKFMLNCMLAHRLMFEEDQATLRYQEYRKSALYEAKHNHRLNLLSDWDLLEDA